MDVRRALLNARDYWYPILLQLHRFMVAVSRVVVNRVGRGGSAPDPLVWDRGSTKKQRKVDIRVNIDLATLPGMVPGFRLRVAVSLVLMWLSGLIVSVCCANSHRFCVLCIGLLTMWTLVTLAFLSWRSLPFSSNGLAIDCSLKRLPGLVQGPIVQFLFLLCLFQKESKFDKDVSSSAAWLEL